jgi:hypothetical protein
MALGTTDDVAIIEGRVGLAVVMANLCGIDRHLKKAQQQGQATHTRIPLSPEGRITILPRMMQSLRHASTPPGCGHASEDVFYRHVFYLLLTMEKAIHDLWGSPYGEGHRPPTEHCGHVAITLMMG